MKVPFVDLGLQYQSLKSELLPTIEDVCAGSRFILSRDVAEFEKEFAAYLGANHAVGVASGTDALHLALRAAGVGPGDEVITVANTFIATVLAIWQAGARPVLVDCHPDSYNMDPGKLKRAITSRTRAIIPVHLFGQAADMDAILQAAKAKGIKVVEDACQAHGAWHNGKRAGTIGDIGCFSFYPGKNLGAYGDGGAVVTNDAGIADKIRLLRDYGQREKYRHLFKGFNSRLDGVQAAVLRVKLRRLDSWNRARIEHAEAYTKQLGRVSRVQTPVLSVSSRCGSEKPSHVFHLYVIRVPGRDEVIRKLASDGIQTGIHYPVPVHLQPAFEDLGYTRGSFPVTEEYAGQILSLPMYAELTEEQIRHVCDCVARALE